MAGKSAEKANKRRIQFKFKSDKFCHSFLGQNQVLIGSTIDVKLAFCYYRAMKRGNVSSQSMREPSAPVIIRASVNGRAPEPMRIRARMTEGVRGQIVEPTIGDIIRAHSTQFSKAIFAKTYKVAGAEQRDGVQIFILESVTEAQ